LSAFRGFMIRNSIKSGWLEVDRYLQIYHNATMSSKRIG
jgi:hypothetical protein